MPVVDNLSVGHVVGADSALLRCYPPLARTVCRREEEAPRYHKEKETMIKLSMTSQFNYSAAGAAAAAV